jgi:peroxiredoxin
MMDTLKIGDRFPELQTTLVGGNALRVPHDLHGSTAVLIFYRGHW